MRQGTPNVKITYLVFALLFLTLHSTSSAQEFDFVIQKMRLLISVNHDDHIFQRCSATSRTPMLSPGTPWNDTATLNISSCDIGRLGIYIRSPDYPKDPKAELMIDIKFLSSYLDNLVMCSIPWNITYRLPTQRHFSSLPGCSTKTVQLVDNAVYMNHIFYFKIYDWEENHIINV
ncbi:uncharacterized protein LOC128177683 [Crassostrea angulata]|uniref:uncharacterized protein LOC128177683 n=1 Tax=Magallana angulata TaxID=2784310 RepID=UPI0022B2097A|nr:uncharacterized protein LOC128177683 [Crassostrea angulata]